ncbi:LuxR C-terminal-related transcriptional regulator [Streptomyces sp. NPDC003023]|uniref:LuxR C-terminal-related transcriptional regulator n=1 Tax=Streptomyces sp. NPDC003023 TaxID=3364675 RepID=UPI00369AA565
MSPLDTPVHALEDGRTAFGLRKWARAYSLFSAADNHAPLAAEDLERLATAAYLVGRDESSSRAWERAHLALLEGGDVPGAARCAFWLGLLLVNRGEPARGGGWIGRAQRLVGEGAVDCVEQGYLVVPMALQTLESGDAPAAYAAFGQAAKIADRFHDRDLAALSLLGRAQALILMGERAQGLGLLDEVMSSVTVDEVSPVVAGIVQCAAIISCQQVFDLRRAQEWAGVLSRWCAEQPDLVPYRGQCLVHRSEMAQMHGEWGTAMTEVRQALDRLSSPPGQPAIGMAYYQQAELLRLQGEFKEAEQAYRHSAEHGHAPQPGLALLRLAQGRPADAKAALSRIVADAQDRPTRTKVLAAYVEVVLAAGEASDDNRSDDDRSDDNRSDEDRSDVASGHLSAARTAADELAAAAADFDAPLLRAISAQATGTVLLAEGDPRAACAELNRARQLWLELRVPYEDARTRALIGLACHRLGDHDTAGLDLEGARGVFRELGAAPDLARLETLDPDRRPAPATAGGLTDREVQVLALAAAGRTNRDIAAELVISEHTVRRHLQNVFAKLGVSSRAAATAFAYRHGVL